MVGKLCDLVLIDAPHLVPPEAHGLSASEVTEEQRGWWFSQPHGYFKVCMFCLFRNAFDGRKYLIYFQKKYEMNLG